MSSTVAWTTISLSIVSRSNPCRTKVVASAAAADSTSATVIKEDLTTMCLACTAHLRSIEELRQRDSGSAIEVWEGLRKPGEGLGSGEPAAEMFRGDCTKQP